MKKLGQRAIRIMTLLWMTGPQHRLGLELTLSMGAIQPSIDDLVQAGYLEVMPRRKGEWIDRYELTQLGVDAISDKVKHEQRREPAAYDTYVPTNKTPIRPGALDAFQLPSRGF